MTTPRPAPLPRPRPLPAAATKSYNVASTWETAAALTDTQLRILDEIADQVSQRPLPPHLASENSGAPIAAPPPPRAGTPVSLGEGEGSSSEAGTEHGPATSLEEAILSNSNAFYKWVTELEAARSSETEEKYQQYVTALNHHLAACNAIRDKVDATLSRFDTLRKQHSTVAASTKTLHDSCEKMVREKETLQQFADALRAKLRHFEELDSIASDIARAKAAADANHFPPLLQRLDDCISYMTTTAPQYCESHMYAAKYRQLQAQAMNAVQQRVASVLREAYNKVQEAVRESGKAPPPAGRGSGTANGEVANGGGVLPAGAEAAVLYVRFRAAAEAGLKPLLQGLEARASRSEYQRLAAKCVSMYCDVRRQLMSTVVAQRVREYASQPLPQLTRNGCAYLMQVCQLEQQLFDHFFPLAASDPGSLVQLMEPLCVLLDDAVRPRLLALQRLEELCEMVDILRLEVLNEQLARRGDTVAPLRPVLERMLADAQSRLTFKAQAHIRERVLRYQPTASDLDYPARLERVAANSGGVREGGAASSGSGTAGEASIEPAPPGDPSTSYDANAPPGTYYGWYPSVQNTLACLSQLYRCVDGPVFSGLAHDAVRAASTAIQLASTQIAKKSSVVDGLLFQIKQLLVLREQLAPFDAELASIEKELDLSHMRDHLHRILAGQASLFSLSMDNALLQFASKGSVRVRESQVDGKRQLESQLKDACERFIVAATQAVVEPLLGFITLCTAVRLDAQGEDATPLREQAFASAKRLAELSGRVRESLQTELPQLVAKMALYLQQPATHAILFKPIKSNIAEAHVQISQLLEAEYTEDERQAVGLMPLQELQELLDSLC